MREFKIQLGDDDPLIADLQAAGATETAGTSKPGYHVPGPYEIALAVGAALVASGNCATPGAALQAAWMAVPEFYIGRDHYLTTLAPMFAASPPEGSTDAAALAS